MQRIGTLPEPERNVYMQEFFENITPLEDAFRNAPLPVITQVVTFVQQASNLDWSILKGPPEKARINLNPLTAIDTTAADIKAGVCPVLSTNSGGGTGSCYALSRTGGRRKNFSGRWVSTSTILSFGGPRRAGAH